MPLSRNARRILFSNFLQIASDPLTSIFIAAFIWRSTGSFFAVAMYFMSVFAFLPLGFLLNALILRHTTIKNAFWLGAFTSGLTALFAISFGGGSPFVLFAYGAVRGLGSGIYWGNRHYLELEETTGPERQYFFSTLFSASWMSRVIMPFIAGWFIVLAPSRGWYSSGHAYWILFAFAFVLMLLTALVVGRGNFGKVPETAITRFGTKLFRNDRRLIMLASGMVDGMGFLTPLLILMFIGDEGVLGTILALVSLATSSAMYLYGRYAKPEHWRKALAASNTLSLLCAVSLIIAKQPISAIFYVLFASPASDFFLMASAPFILSSMEKEIDGDVSLRYAFIFDNEFLLNVGRVFAVSIMLTLAALVTPKVGVTYGPFIAASIQAVLLAAFLIRTKKERAAIPAPQMPTAAEPIKTPARV